MKLPTQEDLERFKAKVKAMSPEERKALIDDLCKGVNEMAEHIVENADEIWASRPQPTIH